MQIPRVDPAPHGVETPSPRVIADWLGLMEPARGESFPSGQRLGPAASGQDSVLSPDQKSFYISTTNTNNLGTKTEIARFDTAPRGVETPPQ